MSTTDKTFEFSELTSMKYVLTFLLTSSLRQIAFLTRVWTVGQEVTTFLWNSKVNYSVQKSLRLELNPRQLNPAHTPVSYVLKIHFNITLPFMPMSPNWSLTFRFSG